MTALQTIIALALVFSLIGAHQAITKLLKLLEGHLERFQGKLDVMVASQAQHNAKLDAILRKLF